MALRLEHVGAPDVRAMVAHHDGPGGAEARVRVRGLELAHQLRLPGRVPDHGHEVDVGVRHAGDALEHLEVPDREVIRAVRGRGVTGQHRRQRMRMDDAPRAERPMRKAEDRVALARSQVSAVG